MATAEIAVMLALAANAAQKICVSIATGTKAFALRVTATFGVWALAAFSTWWIGLKI